jgi:pimeloyl-ACP methyl ester carboxylesterase
MAFDFSGCGESDDERLNAANMTDDLKAAIAWARGRGYRGVGLFGNSLGGRICLMAADDNIAAMVLTGGGTGPMHHDWRAYYGADRIAELQSKGYLTDRVDSRWRMTVEVDRRMLDDFADVDPPSLLGAISCPVLMIHGNHPEDAEECALLQHARNALAWLPVSSRLEVIDGARHGFREHLDEVIALTVPWFADRMTTNRVGA